MMKFIEIVWLLLAVICSAGAAITTKQYVIDKNRFWIYLSLVFNIALVFLFIKIFESDEMNVSYLILKAASIVVVYIFGIFVYGEHLTIIKCISSVVILAALAVLIIEHRRHRGKK